MDFKGYRRKNGTIGVRNHIIIFPTVLCASTVAQMISSGVPGTISVSHPHGCGHLGIDKAHIIRTMAGFCTNPNVAGVLLVGLGCELITPELIADKISKVDQRFEIISIQAEGGTTAAVKKGKLLAKKLVNEIASSKRVEANVSELIIGVKCGGSDTLSGLTANPALGVATDVLTKDCTVLISEIPEMLGAEKVLGRRAATEEVGRRIWQICSEMENNIKKMGVDIRGTEPSPGNIAGGLTTLEEKSLGAILKGGTATIKQVVQYGEKPTEKGLIIMDGPAHDAVCNTGFLSAGAQIIVFTTGRGSPIGTPIAPVIKVSSNSDIYLRMTENIDINAGSILDGIESIESIGKLILSEIALVATGKLTRSEILGHSEFAIHSIGPVV